ncbi:MAG: excinuclease ABC subunit UvrA [Bdellovibrionales bacterium]|jgi:excinuclease ABC subunit A|nr:excinuclease ABC subunit UvrA [Bdellovibrionales bacterium]
MKPLHDRNRYIHLWGVKQNNLKDIEVKIPLGSFTVVCGPSGSGKSSLAFQTLYAEGQRRYIESLSSYARQFLGKAPKPEIEGISNIPPAIAIEQKNSVKTSRSTVGTSTEIVDYLRLLFDKIGQPTCPSYGFAITKDSPSDATRKTLAAVSGKRGYILAPIAARTAANSTQDALSNEDLLRLFQQEGFLRILIPTGATMPKATKKKAAAAKKTSKKKAVKTDETSVASNLNPTASIGLPSCRPDEAIQDIGTVYELKPGDGASVLPLSEFYVVIDRVGFKPEDEGRIGDSIAQAYQASMKFNFGAEFGRATILTTEGQRLVFSEESSCSQCGFIFPQPSAALFSFNSPIGACASCNGFGNTLTLDEAKIIPNPALSLSEGAINPFAMPSATYDRKQLAAYCKRAGIDMKTPWNRLTQTQREKIWNGDDKFYGVVGLFEYLETKKYKMHVRVFLSRYKSPQPCTVCRGSRLKPETLLFLVGGQTISKLSAMTIGALYTFINGLKLTPLQEELAGEIFRQLRSRLKFLNDVGVEYLTLDRATRTLSGGEFQRLNLAKQLGMGLSQTLYVLDEPTVGLHPRDNDRLIGILKQLNEIGNTLVVVEHDHDVIANSTDIIEMGPGSGHLGGEVMYSGETKSFYQSEKSSTAPYLRSDSPLKRSLDKNGLRLRQTSIEDHRYSIELRGCRGNNLKQVDVKFPLNRLVTVTGVSGSGKSTLVSQTLYPIIAQHLRVEYVPVQPFDEIKGLDLIKGVLFIDQSPIGKTARSSPVTYLKVFDAIRAIMAGVPEAKERGYTAGTFSLNVDGGRCPVCKGLGIEVVDMMFMDDVALVCDACDGKKYRREILDVRYKNKNIHEILNMTVDEAMEFFVAHANIRKPLSFLREVGLGYIRLGQSASTLSGGESQRLKIAREFIGTQHKGTLYILDEPTTGLHFREIEMLMKVLHKLVEAGGSVILIEHNLDVIRSSDWVIDLGPDAGLGGGEIVAQGTPDDLMKSAKSLTGKYLKLYLDPSKTPEVRP